MAGGLLRGGGRGVGVRAALARRRGWFESGAGEFGGGPSGVERLLVDGACGGRFLVCFGLCGGDGLFGLLPLVEMAGEFLGDLGTAGRAAVA